MKKPPKKPQERAKKAAPKKAKRTHKEEKDSLPSDAWIEKATVRGYKAVGETLDHILHEVMRWAQGDVRKALTYMVGIVQGLAVQRGRVESILLHSGRIYPPTIKMISTQKYIEAFSAIGEDLGHDVDEEGHAVWKSFEEIAAVVMASSISEPPTEDKNDDSVPDNVIKLPVMPRGKGT